MKNYCLMNDVEFYKLSNEELIELWQDAQKELVRNTDLLNAIGLSVVEVNELTRRFSDPFGWKKADQTAAPYFDSVDDDAIDKSAFAAIIHPLAESCFLTHRAFDALYRNNEKFYISRIHAFAAKSGKKPSMDYVQDMLSEIALNLPSFFQNYDRTKGIKYCTFIGKYLIQPLRNVARGYSSCPLTIYQENLLYRINRVISEFESANMDYDIFMIANKLGIGYKAVSDIMSIKAKMENPISLDDVNDDGLRVSVASGDSVEQQAETNEIRRLVMKAAEKSAALCGDERLSADDYINLITGTSTYSEISSSSHIAMKSYIRQKVDEFIEHFRNTDEVIRLEINDYTHRSSAVENLEDVIESMPLTAVLSVSSEAADAYMEELNENFLDDMILITE